MRPPVRGTGAKGRRAHGARYGKGASLQSVQQLVHLRGVEVLVVMPVDDHHRRTAARGDALFLALQEHAAIGGGFAQPAAEFPLGMLRTGSEWTRDLARAGFADPKAFALGRDGASTSSGTIFTRVFPKLTSPPSGTETSPTRASW